MPMPLLRAVPAVIVIGRTDLLPTSHALRIAAKRCPGPENGPGFFCKCYTR